MEEDIEKIPSPPYPRHEFEPLLGTIHPSGAAFARTGGVVLNVRRADGSVVKAAPLEDASPSLAFSADGRAILVGGHDGRVLSFEATTLKRGPKTPAMYDAVEAIALLGPVHFAAASTRGEGNVYETATMRLVYRAIGPGGIAATSDGSHLFLAIGNKVVCHETRNW